MMNSQKSIETKIYKYIQTKKLINAGEKVCVAVSGGADSVCLLAVLLALQTRLNCEILVCHFNHRLRGEDSDNDEKFILNLCEKWGVKCLIGRAEKKNIYKNESQAREARYHFFQKIMRGESLDKIALAHNLNDSAETVIMRMIRGTGYRGLKSIPPQREKFCRPLLQISRLEIEKYLVDHDISYRIDKTNFNLDLTRNFIRHEILPKFADLNPNILETLGNSGAIIQDDYEYLTEIGREKLKKIRLETADNSMKLDYEAWSGLHSSMRRLTLRLAIESISSLDDISYKQIDEVVAMLLKGEGKKKKSLPHSLIITLDSGKIVLLSAERNQKK